MILVLNAGSANIKLALFDASNLALIAKDQVHKSTEVLAWIKQHCKKELKAIGHRIVHGGKEYFNPIVLNSIILNDLKILIPLAPLHQPYNLELIEACMRNFPNVKQVGCFDTGFHQTQHKLAKLYAIPKELTDEGIIRYGFHGLSYESIASILETKIGPLASAKVIVAHLGGGASMCAMQHCKSVATSMGFTALEGLMMGTRCGNLDPGVILYLLQNKNYSPDELQDLLYYRSGCLGVSQLSADMQTLQASEDPNAILAIELYCYRAACEIGRLSVALQGCNAIVFTGGIGENSAFVRAKVCSWLDWMGVKIDDNHNNRNAVVFSSATSKLLLAAIPTNEEQIIARHCLNL